MESGTIPDSLKSLLNVFLDKINTKVDERRILLKDIESDLDSM